MQKPIDKIFFVSEIIGSQLAVLSCLYEEENTCHRQSMCSKGLLKGDFLEISLTTFFDVRNFRKTSAMRVIFF